MFVFAHAFLGALIGLGFWHLSHDRRALPLCIVSAILPDLLDKPLALLFPGILGAGRTIGHTLFFFGIAMVLGFLLWRYRHTLLGVACACAIFSHQILDEMWNGPAAWYYPLMGPFPNELHPDYVMYSFWREVSTLSEWVFAYALVVVIAAWYLGLPRHRQVFPAERGITPARFIAFLLLAVTGIVLLIAGTGFIAASCFAPTYAPVTGVMAGLLALGGAAILLPRNGVSPFSGN
ncbi:metal-dependent hydrolase [Methanoregula sp.]|uniref:metal-dependent hydrolase n=1 Tax=Methanoregula sp. TaxID=2052170 RepID=UPI002368FFBD|nr:metal-dependent hydrolase [Methanoregula sp.]MDD1685459.1 metal-dependent hydrolase [Methanoregula sp.]